jgi:glucose-1-phosphate thymidylyltransferase
MIGVVLAGGKGTRLLPITSEVNKVILPVGDKPMVYYPLSTLVSSGITEIVVVISDYFGEQVRNIVKLLKLPVKIKFAKQKELLGMPSAIDAAKKLVGNRPFIVVGGDNIFGGKYTKVIDMFKDGEVSFLRKVKDPSKSGVPFYDKSGNLVDIIEKPKNPPSNYAICGPHIFDSSVFNKIAKLKLSQRGELELVDLHKLYLKEGKLKLINANDYWSDVGTFSDMAEASYRMIRRK